MSSSNPDVIRLRGVNKFKAGDFKGAVVDFEQLVTLTDHPADHLWHGQALHMTGRYAEACASYETVIARAPDNPIAYNWLAHIRACCSDTAMRNGKEAIRLATRACKLSSWKSWGYVSVLAAAYAENGEWEQAIHFAEQALKDAPKHEKARREAVLGMYKDQKPFRAPPGTEWEQVVLRPDGVTGELLHSKQIDVITELDEPILIAQVTLLSAEESGNAGPVFSCWRPLLHYEGDPPNHHHVIEVRFESTRITPGESARCVIRLHRPEEHRGRATLGIRFHLLDGSNPRATGVVKEILGFPE